MFAAAATTSSSRATRRRRRLPPQRRRRPLHTHTRARARIHTHTHTHTHTHDTRAPRRAATRVVGSALARPPLQERWATDSHREALPRSLVPVVLLELPPLPPPPPPGITRVPRSQTAALVAMMMMSRTQPLGEGRRVNTGQFTPRLCIYIWGHPAKQVGQPELLNL
ncbi:uncharacterized protein LOC111755825 isoform X2 [Cavia porcellus]|uniref:uncharacterized protein LOC111755825 isoform X2 n=1 Tax=Cavia porcellus TaxID=10141 RepID=UPI002FE17DC3